LKLLYTRRGHLKQGQRPFHKYKSDAEKEELETALFEGRAPTLSKDSNARRWQLTETFESTPESIWEDIDMLEGDATHRGIGPCATPDKTILLFTKLSDPPKLELLIASRHVLLCH
jgi:hypothetical protein